MESDSGDENVLICQGSLPISTLQICTSSDGRACHFIRNIKALNKVLAVIRCRLEQHKPDQLRLVSSSLVPESALTEEETRKAVVIVFWLVKNHRCLASVNLTLYKQLHEVKEHHLLLLRSLQYAPGLMELRLNGMLWSPATMPDLSQLSSLCMLRKFECDMGDAPEVAEVLSRILQTSLCLTDVRITINGHANSSENEVFAALEKAKKLENLEVTFWHTVHYAHQENCVAIYECLQKTCTLVRLHLAYQLRGAAEGLIAVLKSLYRNKRLQEVILEGYSLDVEESKAIQKFLEANATVRTFQLRMCKWKSAGAGAALYDTDDFGTLTPQIWPWLEILKYNQSLRTLGMSLKGFSPAECAAILYTLKRNSTLSAMNIDDFQEYCVALSRRGHGWRIQGVFREHTIHPRLVLAKCKKIREGKLTIRNATSLEWFVTAAATLELTNHVNKFHLDLCDQVPTQQSASLIASFIEESSTLHEVELYLFSSRGPPTSEVAEVVSTIITAVCRNTTIRYLLLFNHRFTVHDARYLAKTLASSKTICNVHLSLDPDVGLDCLSYIVPRISCNYTLAHFRMASVPPQGAVGYQAIQSVAERNRLLVARAATLATGSSSAASAEAMELVSSNPLLVTELCQLAFVDDLDARRMIRNGLRGLQDIDNFMKMTQVVKRRVECYMDGSRLRLEDIDLDSWYSVRKYLRLADVSK